jgi:SAM-dependent methyltransferase
MNCYYCDWIARAEPAYAPRDAEFDRDSEAPRCAWHWRFVCDHCGEAGHFMARFFCPRSGRLLCREAGEVAIEYGACRGWEYWWALGCPDCGERHPSLDRAEALGAHPWQVAPAAARRRLSAEPHLTRYPPGRLPPVDAATLTDADSDANWSANADIWEAGYDERGDLNRRYQSDPVLLAFLGDLRGKRVLDAGSGAGYLSRLLARRGARMVAVENARRFHEIALAHQGREPLDIAFHHASISALPFLAEASFDAAVANYVLMDVRDYEAAIAAIARLLRPGGHFVFAIARGTTSGRWHTPAPDSPRPEDRAGWLDDDYFLRRAGYVQWGRFAPILTFDRPLRDYVAACRASGLELRDLEEPEVSAEGERDLPAPTVRKLRRKPDSYILKVVKRG